MKKFFQDFKAFALRGNVMDLAVGVIIGGAFGKIVSSLVNDLLMPLIGLILGGVNLSGAFYALDGQTYGSIAEATEAGAGTLNYGLFIQAVIDFLLVALCIFLFLRAIAKFLPKKKEEAPAPDPRQCPFCFQPVHDKASRCPHCTSQL